jgi:WD40 repeat protein
VAEHAAAVTGIAFRPDARQLAVGDASGKVRLWTTVGKSDNPLRLSHDAGTPVLSWDPTGRWLATWDHGLGAVDRPKVRLHDTTTPPAVSPSDSEPVRNKP